MKRALRLAAKGKGSTSPNPMVGAVVVQRHRIVGHGYHRRAGGPHAEVIALKKAGVGARNATLYVTLEPCCHTAKRTPPCVPAIQSAGVTRVVVAMPDPNPKVQGAGIRQLRQAGIRVDVGCLRKAAEELNQAYVQWITTGYPFVTLKGAMTLDGKIATSTGESKWITGEESRRQVHLLRSQVDAILVGVETVLKDDPSLSSREADRDRRSSHVRQPVRVVLDSHLRTPLKAKVFRWPLEQPTIVCTSSQASLSKIARLQKAGVNVLIVPQRRGVLSLAACFKKLGRMGITSLLIEGGGRVNASALREGVVNDMRLYMAPKLLGGDDSVNLLAGRSPKRLSHAISIQDVTFHRIGQDFLITGRCPDTIYQNMSKR
ncbi:MAG: bifunctional diaminohydroxyphosphoribosylaminopyrimidine deaminase/5-amino-6-(5-phosphoribosylamino)uracil reductase RibD [Nitrospirales bacterium]|nr:bifunctional diaminohydroxyphosphoribosylaminopyrimidine deaminase/5-amino-6-(5-phosphoribosylamino)uracil reductase RibD [Nitrospira sp.]MDR4501976.1 bifunctional diaminohydroxyphosphoribosylaminopyrimidine deaminase/5-amino-6-(5-phosphoribosylamino)uracil reductase RibD [Nitrospirales bacterium]